MKSEQINELATALCKLQGNLIDTDKSKAAYNYKYSDLSSILTYIRPLMAEHGLSVTQLVNGDDSAQIGVETILMHNSGQWISTQASMHGQGQNLAQEAGKVSTYLRRYQLAAIIGLTQKDEDAALSKNTTKYIANIKNCKTIPQLTALYNSLDEGGKAARKNEFHNKRIELEGK